MCYVFKRIVLEPPNKKFKKGTVETFNVEAIDVGSIKRLEVIIAVILKTFVEDLGAHLR